MKTLHRFSSMLLVGALIMTAIPAHAGSPIDWFRNKVEKYLVQKKADEGIKELEKESTKFIKEGDPTAMTLLCVAVSCVIGLVAYQAIRNGDNKEVSFFDQLLGMLQWAFGKEKLQKKADDGEKHIKETTQLGRFVSSAENKVNALNKVVDGFNELTSFDEPAKQPVAPQPNVNQNVNQNQTIPGNQPNQLPQQPVNGNVLVQQPTVTTGQSTVTNAQPANQAPAQGQPQQQKDSFLTTMGKVIISGIDGAKSGIDAAKSLFGDDNKKQQSGNNAIVPTTNQN